MKKLAIISSYNESCGNATYTEALRKEFLKHFHVEIIGLNVGLLNKQHPSMIKLGNEHIQDIANKLAEFDYVNIQFEAGLFGSTPHIIYKRIALLIQTAKNLILTMHRYDPKGSILQKSHLKLLLRGKISKFGKDIALTLYRNRFAKQYEKVILACKKNNAAIIVHTKRDKELILRKYKHKRIYDFPLTFLNKEEITHYAHQTNKAAFLQKIGLNKNCITVGIFGYISHYKGHHIAIKAMKYLPENYHLLIFGSQHPMSITENQETEPYLESLIKFIEKDTRDLAKNNLHNAAATSQVFSTPLINRVHFCGSLNDEEFINALMCCDFTVLPYLEVNQGGSGIASLTLETRAKAIFSQNLAFIELAKYAPNCYKTISIGNHLELAESIKNYREESYTHGLEKYRSTYNIQNNIEFHKQIFEGKI